MTKAREFIWVGVQESAGFYIVGAAVMVVLSVTGRAQEGAHVSTKD